MLNRQKQYKQLLQLAEEKEQSAALKLAQLQGTYSHQQKQLTALINYKGQYQHDMFIPGQTVTSASRLHEYYGFLENLDKAIAQQKHSLQQVELTVNRQRLAWMQENQQSQIYRKLLERMQEEENIRVRKQEQFIMDEHNIQKFDAER